MRARAYVRVCVYNVYVYYSKACGKTGRERHSCRFALGGRSNESRGAADDDDDDDDQRPRKLRSILCHLGMIVNRYAQTAHANRHCQKKMADSWCLMA